MFVRCLHNKVADAQKAAREWRFFMNKLHLSENIVRLRRDKGITQEELAAFVGVTKASVSKWETGQSMPDILLLPLLAAFFGVSVDELLGYEPQMSREQIRACYLSLAEDFARRPFMETLEKSRELVKQYYTCYPFLIQICILWMNHYMMAESEETRQEILMQIGELCDHILTECKDLNLCNHVVSIKAMMDLLKGKTEEVIASLESITHSTSFQEQNILLLAQAYLQKGIPDQADKVLQISLYQNTLGLLNAGILLLIVSAQDQNRCEAVMKRMDALISTFRLEELNPNAVAGYEFQAAVTMCGFQEEEVYERLERYAKAAANLLKGGIFLHGDQFFNKIEEWFEEFDLGSQGVRNRKLVEESALKAFEHPAIRGLSDQERLAKIRKAVERECLELQI